ncbi:MAG: MFS transporter, partial [Sphingobium sp.]|uniref:MFS transporter n=1 Tax=Sphingobium sp. TaxID=1912891 RepID=UPI0029A06F9E
MDNSPPAGAAQMGFASSQSKSGKAVLLVLLMLANAFGYVDRQILTVLAIPISHDLGLTNVQIGMMSGLAFALFYAICGIPLAWLADRTNRVWVLAGSIAVWSAMTSLCGAASSFWTLFAARVGVGIGEAGCTPPAHSLISDTISPSRRASALAVYNLGLPLGSFAGLALGGWLAQTLGWKTAFVIVGLPGCLLAAVIALLLRDPRHGGGQADGEQAPSFGTVLKQLRKRRAYWHLMVQTVWKRVKYAMMRRQSGGSNGSLH